METFDFRVCCRGLAEALGGRAAEGGGAALRLCVGDDGALYYKIGHAADGRFTGASGERAAFCPFCGRAVVGDGAVTRALPRPDEPDEEATRWHLAELQEVETVLA